MRLSTQEDAGALIRSASELYVDDPSEVEMADLRTELCWPLA